MSDNRWLIVGLGNPGSSYAGNRHNIGHMVLDYLVREAGAKFGRDKSGLVTALARWGGTPAQPDAATVLAQTTCYMNVSGGQVANAAKYYGIPPERVIVVHDELDLPFGTIRLKMGGGEGGHNGLKDITKALGTRDYLRVRAGIGRPPGRMDAATYVLRDFTTQERDERDLMTVLAGDAAVLVARRGLTEAQQQVHSP